MQCSDLERYLEAFLDLRLGRSRGAILRRHLSACAHCRARVEHLRSFERDLQRSFRAMERAQSVWTGLEPDLVRSGGLAEGPPVLPFLGPADPPRRSSALTETIGRRPARAPTRPDVEAARARLRQGRSSRWGQRTAGLLLLVVASLGAGLLVLRAWSAAGPPDLDLGSHAELHGSDVAVQFASDDPGELGRQLAPWFGDGLPALPTPAGFNLVGASIDERSDGVRAVVAYRRDGDATLLLIWPQPGAAAATAAPVASNTDGMSQLRWTHAGLAYAVVSPLPEADLLPFTWGGAPQP
ncbi:MAG TPA: hypothetical protein PKA13_08130 [Geminicoccaceae bacterium]|nr:hypothetical protein [Geminicoccus sp.]HMU49729.1 hypothetical protein [Geminicoccaceae bacterium]